MAPFSCRLPPPSPPHKAIWQRIPFHFNCLNNLFETPLERILTIVFKDCWWTRPTAKDRRLDESLHGWKEPQRIWYKNVWESVGSPKESWKNPRRSQKGSNVALRTWKDVEGSRRIPKHRSQSVEIHLNPLRTAKNPEGSRKIPILINRYTTPKNPGESQTIPETTITWKNVEGSFWSRRNPFKPSTNCKESRRIPILKNG